MNNKIEDKPEQTHQQFDLLLNGNLPTDIEALKNLTWHGVPYQLRPTVWKILLGYLPSDKASRDSVLTSKRQEYIRLIEVYFTDINARSPKDDKQIAFACLCKDAPRIRPDYALFRHQVIFDIMIRSALIWYITQSADRHESLKFAALLSLIVPLIAAFIGEYVENIDCETFNVPENFEEQFGKEERLKLEADVFWCVHGVMDKVLKNFSFLNKDLNVPFEKMNEILKKSDPELVNHFENQEIPMMNLTFSWMACFMGMDFSPQMEMRLFDTYIADEQGFGVLHCYFCCAILLKYSSQIKQMQMEDIFDLKSDIKLKDWTQAELREIIEEANRLRTLLKDAKGYLLSWKKITQIEERKGCSCF